MRAGKYPALVWLLLFLLMAGAMTGCQEELTSPGECPSLCPGGDSEVFEVTLNPIPGTDSSYMPYFQVGQGGSVLASNGLPAAEARAVYRFAARSDSVEVRDTLRAFAIDSVLLAFNLVARDTLTNGLKLYLYRLPPTVDAGITFADIDALMVEANLLDSIPVPDTLNAGAVRAVFSGDELGRVALASGEPLAVGIGVAADQPTGVRLGSIAGGNGPSFVTYVTVDIADTATSVRNQQIQRPANFNTFVVESPPVIDTTLLTVGGAPSSRALLRFDLPQEIEDSGTIVRATLELTPPGPILGLPTDPGVLTATAVLADLGAKSPVTQDLTFISADTVTPGISGTVRIDVTRLVQLWVQSSDRPEAIFLNLLPEAASFMRAEFGSTRRPDIGAPRLIVDYQMPFPFARP
jgi:hypothetical protein